MSSNGQWYLRAVPQIQALTLYKSKNEMGENKHFTWEIFTDEKEKKIIKNNICNKCRGKKHQDGMTF